MISKNDIIQFFELKSLKYDEVKVTIWQDFLKELPDESVKSALKGIITDVSIINPSAGHVIDYIRRQAGETKAIEAEDAWLRVLKSVKAGGSIDISAREAKALNSMGGMEWLRDAKKEDINWQRKEFIEIYSHTPEQNEVDFRCPGLEANILPDTNTKFLEA